MEPLLDAVECAPPDWADEPFEPTAGVAASHLVNVPALTTLHRGALAQLRGDAEATAAFAAQMLAEIGEAMQASPGLPGKKLVLDMATKGVREAANAIALDQSPR